MKPAAPVTTTRVGRLSIGQGCRPRAADCNLSLIPMNRFESWLAATEVGVTVREFPQGTRTAVDAARAVGCDVGQIVKSLVFVAGGNPGVALVSGANRTAEHRPASGAARTVGKAGAGTG